MTADTLRNAWHKLKLNIPYEAVTEPIVTTSGETVSDDVDNENMLVCLTRPLPLTDRKFQAGLYYE